MNYKGAMLSYALASATALSTDRVYANLTGQGFVNSSKPRKDKAKQKRAKNKKSRSSRKANRKK